MRKRIAAVLSSLFLIALGAALSNASASPNSQVQGPGEPQSQQKISREVRHQLVLLPYYSVFDNLEFQVQGGTVTLTGQVVRPSLRSDAQAAVKSIEGVAKVVNNIEVLPLSPNDDRLRRDLYRAIYGTEGLDRYALAAVPAIHIIVKHGDATLVGLAANQTDRNIAEIKARGVSGVFSVQNNLRVENGAS